MQTTLGVSNVSFGLNPAARAVLNSVFLNECVKAGLDSAIVHAARIMPIARIPADQLQVALDLVYDRRRDGYDPLTRLLELFEGVDTASLKASRAAELHGLPLWERLKRRIIDGERLGLEADLDEALRQRPALEIVNDVLLDGMKTVGDLFGSGQMQLPFVLTSAEVMKAAVGYLEPHMERSGEAGKGKIVLATVKGDVHDIGKNLVDIIVSNNGYDVVNLGIKQPISSIVQAATEHDADVIGMSGLLVKSTVVMRDNLAELNSRGLAGRWPVLLGGAALTRSYVEQDLASLFDGEVRYARDAFEGLRLMDALMAVKRGEPGAALPALRERRVRRRAGAGDDGQAAADGGSASTGADQPDGTTARALVRSDVSLDEPVPQPPFRGTRVVKGIPLADYASYLDERALFLGQWGLKPTRGGTGPSHEELAETQGRPRLRMWLERAQTEGLLQAAVVHGYFPCVSEGDDLIVLDDDGGERERFTFPRQRRDRRLCLADFFRPRASGETDVVAFQLVTIGPAISEATGELFAKHAYRDYLELHGLSVQLAEALAEYWHARTRAALGISGGDPDDLDGILRVGYQGCRYSFGYPACPDLEDRAKVMRLLEPERIGVHAVRGVPARTRAVHRRADRASPRGEVLQHLMGPIPSKRAAPDGQLQAVLFDMDGLLVDSEPLWFEVEHSVMSRLGGEWTQADQRALVGGSLHRSVGYLLSRASSRPRHDEVADWLIGGMAELLAEREVAVMPGAIDLLAEVRAAGIPRALVTSSERVIMDAVLASLARHDIAFDGDRLRRRRGQAQAAPRALPAGRRADRRRPAVLRGARGLADRRRLRAGRRLRHDRRARRHDRCSHGPGSPRRLARRRRPGPA